MSKKFVERKKLIKNNKLAKQISEVNKDPKKLWDKVFSITSRTSKKSYADTSLKKLSVVAKIIRGKNAEEALNILHNLPQKAAKILYKHVKSAMYNAKNNAWLSIDNLYVERVDLWRWIKIKRMRFVSRSRVHWYQKYRSFIRVVLNSN